MNAATSVFISRSALGSAWAYGSEVLGFYKHFAAWLKLCSYEEHSRMKSTTAAYGSEEGSILAIGSQGWQSSAEWP